MRRDVIATSLAPIVATLRDVEAMHGHASVHGLVPGLVPEDTTGWTRATALTDGGAALDDLLDAAKQRWHAQPHAAAALAWKCYTYWLTLPALAGYAAARRVPLPRLDNVLVRYSQRQPFLKLALRRPTVAVLATDPIAATGHPRIIPVADDAALLEHLRRTVVDEHLTPLMAGVQTRVHLGRRTLWGSLASGAAHGVARIAGTGTGLTRVTAAATTPALALIDEVLAALGVADLVDVYTDATGKLRIDRRTCCLAFTLPEPKICAGCCIR